MSYQVRKIQGFGTKGRTGTAISATITTQTISPKFIPFPLLYEKRKPKCILQKSERKIIDNYYYSIYKTNIS